MKKFDAGIPEKEQYGVPLSTKEAGNRIIYPTVDLTEKQFPPLKGKDFNDRFTIETDVRVKGVRKNEKRVTYDLEIIKIGLKGGKMSEKEFAKLPKEEQEEHMKKSVE